MASPNPSYDQCKAVARIAATLSVDSARAADAAYDHKQTGERLSTIQRGVDTTKGQLAGILTELGVTSGLVEPLTLLMVQVYRTAYEEGQRGAEVIGPATQ